MEKARIFNKMTRGSKIFSTIIFVFVTVVSYFLLRDVKIDDSDIMETTIIIEDAYTDMGKNFIIIKSSNKAYFRFKYPVHAGNSEAAKYYRDDFCKILKSEGEFKIKYIVSHPVSPTQWQYWRTIVDLRTDTKVYYSLDDFLGTGQNKTLIVLMKVGYVVFLYIPFLGLYVLGFVIYYWTSDYKDEQGRKKRNRQKMLKKKSGTHLPGENGKKKKR